MTKLQECARAVVPHICRATQDCDSEQDARDLRQAREISRAVIRCLMEPSEGMVAAGGAEIYGHPREKAEEWAKEEKFDSCAYQATDTLRAMLQSVLDENKE